VRRATAGPLPLFVTRGAARPATVLSGTPAYGPPRLRPGPPYRLIGTAVTPGRPHATAHRGAPRGTRPAGPRASGAPAPIGPGIVPAAVALGASRADPCPPEATARARSAAVPPPATVPDHSDTPRGGSRPASSAASAVVLRRSADRIGPPAPWGRSA
jgi:hypothetical protein